MRKSAFRTGSCLLSWILAAGLLSAQEHPGAPAPLFAHMQPLEITLTADFKSIGQRSGWETDRWYDARLTMTEAEKTRSLDVRLKLRSGFRTRDNNCNFPQFFLSLDTAQATDTVFAGQNILPLTTHCRGSSIYSRYIHREYIAYRIYNLLTDHSLRVRSALITYMRSDKPIKVAKRYGFFVEHFDALAERVAAEQVDLEVFHPATGEAFEMGVLELFEFMIGNTDFSTAYEHNIVLMQRPGERIFGVPYDFDFSGLVNARYAEPAEQFRTRSVRTRIYRGWCRNDDDLDRVVAHFQSKREAIFALLDEFSWMPEKVVSDAADYLRSFYEVLDDPRQLDKDVRSKCARGTPVRGD